MRLSLPSLFQVVLLSLPTLAACSSAETSVVTDEERTQFQALSCQTPLAGLSAQLGVDGIELVTRSGASTSIAAADGTLCGGQTAGPCAEALREAERVEPGYIVDGLTSGGGFDHPGSPERVVATEGDAVTVWDTRPRLSSALLPLDSTEKLGLFLRYFHGRLSCLPARPVEGGFEILAEDYETDCNVTADILFFVSSADGSIVERKTANRNRQGPECAYGRRPAGLEPLGALPLGPIAAHFARAAHLESASVEAFVRLADELQGHGAPAALVAECLQAAADEVRHASAMGDLAERFGASAEEPRIAPVAPRSLVQLALENAVEGCVRETFGALEACFQADHAADPEVAAAMATIARDETAHATLSWAIHAWAEDHLSPDEWSEVEAAMAREIDALEAETGRPRSASLVALAGLPDEDTALALLAGLRDRLWGAPALAA